MKGMIGAVVLGSLLVASAPGAADAQARGYVGVGGGVSVPIGDFKDGVKLGWLGQVIGGVKINDIFGVRVNGSYGQHKLKGTGGGNFKIIGGMGDVVLSPKTSGNAAPYVLAGAGFQNGKAGGSSETNWAWNAGVGVSVKAGSGNVGIYAEARFLSTHNKGAPSGSSKFSNAIPVTVGVRIGK
jgi:hypothetical protein